MFPAFLITFREVIEASLVVATILGILTKLNRTKSAHSVWTGTITATLISFLLIGIGSFAGLKVQEWFEKGKVEQLFEGALLIISSVFITWAVFVLHRYFAQYKTHLLAKIKSVVEKEKEHRALFALAFTAVFREGIEIVLFLSSMYLADKPEHILIGFMGGVLGGIGISLALFTTTLKLPVYYAFRTTSILLVLFAAGMLSRGIHEFTEAGYIPEFYKLTSVLVPKSGSSVSEFINAVFGLRKTMDATELASYTAYILTMNWWLFIKPLKNRPEQAIA